MQQGVLTKSRSKPRNILRGIVPTADGWDTPPSELANITNGNLESKTGVGVKSLSGAGVIGTIIFDMGSVKSILITSLINAWASTGSGQIDVQVKVSDDGTNWSSTTGDKCGNCTATEENYISKIVFDNAPLIITRYFQLRFYGSAAMTANVRLTEILAYDMGV